VAAGLAELEEQALVLEQALGVVALAGPVASSHHH